jgi:gluconolactonase
MDLSRIPPPPGNSPGAVTPRPATGGLAGGAILKLDLNTKRITPLYTQCDGHALVGPNKLVLDEWGDLWITDVLEGSLYWARADGSSIRRVVSSLPGAHGIALGPDLRTVYVSSDAQVVAFTISGRGLLAGGRLRPRSRVVAVLNPTWRVDGIRTQADGTIVMADWSEGLIAMTPSGTVLSITRLPGLSIANFVFGGADMRTMYATVSETNAGGPGHGIGKIVMLPWPRPGLKPV